MKSLHLSDYKANDILAIDRAYIDYEKYFYGESANAIKIQIWITLIANMLLTLFQRRLERSWSFSRLATMVRIVLMYYINMDTFFERPEEDWETIRQKAMIRQKAIGQAQIATSDSPPK